MRARRWLDGGERLDDLGEDIKVGLSSRYGTLKIKI